MKTKNLDISIKTAYLAGYHRKLLLLSVPAGVILMMAVYAVTQGSYEIPVKDVLMALMGKADHTSRVVIINLRLPRVVSSVICGWGLSLSGLCIQSVLKNPLGSPSTLGISQGAAFGAALSIVVLGSRVMSVTGFAFIGALAATLVILVLARLKKLSPEAVILAGVALSSLFASATILIQYLATETELAMVVFWTFGDVARSNWREIALMAAAVTICTGYLSAMRWDFNAMASGEETARGLGIDVEKLRILGMVSAAVVAADYCKKPEFYNTLKAFAHRRVYTLLPFNWCTTNIGTALADAYAIGKIIYPKPFEDVSPRQKADEIYTFLVGKPVYESMQKDYDPIGQKAPFLN